MNCRDIEPLLLAEKDGVLTPAQHAALGQHVAACPACRQMRADISSALFALQTDATTVRIPDVDAEWHTLRARLHDGTISSEKKRTIAPVIWFAAPLAAAAAIAFVFFTQSSFPKPQTQDTGPESSNAVASAEFVEAGNADASTMVYVDKESGWLVVWATDSEAERSI